MDELLTVIIQTSPIPSHPSTALLEALFRSFQKVDGLLESKIYIVCDGCDTLLSGEAENHKHGKALPETADKYQQFLERLELKVNKSEAPFVPQSNGSINVMKLDKRHGSARAIQAAFRVVSTPLVMIGQHDNFFIEKAPLRSCVRAMNENHGLGIDLKCLHFMSTATMDYPTKIRKRYGIEIQQQHVMHKGSNFCLVPLVFWYGRTHLSYANHYRDCILNRSFRTKDHLEEVMGVKQLRDIQKRGIQAHVDYGTFVLDQGIPALYHLSGRRVLASDDKEEQAATESSPATQQDPSSSIGRAREPAQGSFTTATSCQAIVPGLKVIPKRHSPKGRFKQKCFHCGEKGHSYAWCPRLKEEEAIDKQTIDLS